MSENDDLKYYLTEEQRQSIRTMLDEALASLETLGNLHDGIGDTMDAVSSQEIVESDGEETPDPEPDPEPEDGFGVFLVEVTEKTATIGISGVTIGDTLTVGRDGTDRTGYGPWSGSTVVTELVADSGTAAQWSFDKLYANTTYHFTVSSAEYGATSIAVTTMPAPDGSGSSSGGVSGSGAVALIGHSGLKVNVLSFQGQNNLSGIAGTAAQVGLPASDGLLYFPGRASWDEIKYGLDSGGAEVLAAGKMVVYSVPFAPVSEGTAMVGKAANGDYATKWREIAAYWASKDYNTSRLVIRLGWEYNGDWYPWSVKYSSATQFKNAFIWTVESIWDGGCGNPLYNLCNNKGPSQSGVGPEDVFPGSEYCHVIGVDQYDHWGKSTSSASFTAEASKDPALLTNIAFAREAGVLWSVDETGPVHSANGGGDNALFATEMLKVVDQYADDCAWYNIYNETGAPATYQHHLSVNPSYRAALAAGLQTLKMV